MSLSGWLPGLLTRWNWTPRRLRSIPESFPCCCRQEGGALGEIATWLAWLPPVGFAGMPAMYCDVKPTVPVPTIVVAAVRVARSKEGSWFLFQRCMLCNTHPSKATGPSAIYDTRSFPTSPKGRRQEPQLLAAGPAAAGVQEEQSVLRRQRTGPLPAQGAPGVASQVGV